MELFFSKFQLFALLFGRMLAMISVMPGFGGEAVSFFYRVGLSFFFSVAVTPVVQFPDNIDLLIRNNFIMLLIEQVTIGLLIGISMQFLLAAFQIAGEFFSVQMGFGISEVFDPMAMVSLPLMGTIKNLIALYVFFVSNAHLFTFKALIYSFTSQPVLLHNFLMNAPAKESLTKFMVLLTSSIFLIGLKIALPIMGTLFLVSITLGLVSKAAPQMNILMLGFPIKIMIAFVILTWTAPIIVETISAQYDLFFKHLDTLLKNWAGSNKI